MTLKHGYKHDKVDRPDIDDELGYDWEESNIIRNKECLIFKSLCTFS